MVDSARESGWFICLFCLVPGKLDDHLKNCIYTHSQPLEYS